MLDRKAYELIRQKHGLHGSWAVWAKPGDSAKSNIGILTVLDPDRNPNLLSMLRNDVVMLGLNLSRDHPPPLGNFHDANPISQDYKIRYAFVGTPYYGAYMTDLIKDVVMPKSGSLTRFLGSNTLLINESVRRLLEEFDDLGCQSPMIIAFGGDVHRVAKKYVPAHRYSRLVRVMHYSQYISREHYRERVLLELGLRR
jgi:hypothetical protein